MDTQNQLFILVSTIVVASPLAILFYLRSKKGSTITNKSKDPSPKKVPISVNYHFSRKCNYECGFCFHTAKTSHVLTLEQAKEGLTKLKEAGMKKINFAGGEPFLYPKFLGELVVFCKQTLQLESVSIISNGSLIKEVWMEKYAKLITNYYLLFYYLLCYSVTLLLFTFFLFTRFNRSRGGAQLSVTRDK
jgi:radical S-adenosyl methionine domain-containing protein 2